MTDRKGEGHRHKEEKEGEMEEGRESQRENRKMLPSSYPDEYPALGTLPTGAGVSPHSTSPTVTQ